MESEEQEPERKWGVGEIAELILIFFMTALRSKSVNIEKKVLKNCQLGWGLNMIKLKKGFILLCF